MKNKKPVYRSYTFDQRIKKFEQVFPTGKEIKAEVRLVPFELVEVVFILAKKKEVPKFCLK